MRRVVVTGMGAITPVGNDIDTMWANMLAGVNGVEKITSFDTSDLKVHLAGTVKNFEPEKYIEKRELRKLDIYCQYAIAAAQQAVDDSGILGNINEERFGVYIGAGIGGLHSFVNNVTALNEGGPRKVSPFFIPMMIGNIATGNVAIRFKAKGVSLSVMSACATGTHSIGEAFHAIKDGYADAIIAGGTEAVIAPLTIAGFQNMKALSTNEDPETASRPFDKNRDGFVMGEGAGMLVLEEYEHAKARGANIYAEVIGYGATCDAYHETSPDPEGKGGAKAMEFAVKESGRAPETFNYVNAHGTSTPMNDKTETAAVKLVFGEHAKNMVINSTKSMTGHLLGAAGGVEAVACALQIKNSKVHRTLGLKVADPECDLDYAADGTRDMKITGALSNSLGFGGHNACIAFAPVED